MVTYQDWINMLFPKSLPWLLKKQFGIFAEPIIYTNTLLVSYFYFVNNHLTTLANTNYLEKTVDKNFFKAYNPSR